MKLAFYICFLFITFWQTDSYTEAKRLYDNKEYKGSIQICTTELGKLKPEDALFMKFLSLRVNSYLELHNYAAGIKDYIVLIRISPKTTSNYIDLSYMYGEINDYKNCLAILEKALILEPKNIYIYNNLSYYSSQVGNYDDAVKYAEDGIKIVADPVWKGTLLSNKSYGFIGLKKYKEALININKSIGLNPNNSFAYCFRAIANINLKNFETVCDDLNKAKSLGAVKLTEDLIKQNCNIK
jgi:tetratricopeptide (TPR) repeat protein